MSSQDNCNNRKQGTVIVVYGYDSKIHHEDCTLFKQQLHPDSNVSKLTGWGEAQGCSSHTLLWGWRPPWYPSLGSQHFMCTVRGTMENVYILIVPVHAHAICLFFILLINVHSACSYTRWVFMSMLHIPALDLCPCPCCMPVPMLHVCVTAAWTWTCSIGHGHAQWTCNPAA
jgi:hypothetical protein